MHILIALYKYISWGGLQLDAWRVAEAAVAAGHSVTFFSTSWEPPLPSVPGITIEFPKEKIRGLTNHAQMASFAKAFQKRLQQKDYDVSYAMNRIPGADFYFAADSCMKTYLEKSRSWLSRHLLPRYRAILNMEQQVIGKASDTTILTISPIQIAEYQAAYGIPSWRLQALPPGQSAQFNRPSNADELRWQKRQELGLTDEQLAIILVGTNAHRKGVDRVLAAIAALPTALKKRCVLFLVGNDQEKTVLPLAEQQNLSGQFRFLGVRKDVPQLLLAADIMVHPAREEGTGTVLTEAIASGLPVICSGACGYYPFIQEATGTVTPEPFRQSDLNEMLLKALQNLRPLQTQTRQYASQHDFTARSQVTIQLFEEFVKRHPHTATPATPSEDDLFQAHRDTLSQHLALKESAKRHVTCDLINGQRFIVKEYRNDSWLRNHSARTKTITRRLAHFTPPCIADFSREGANFLAFTYCGSPNFYEKDAYCQPDTLQRVRDCGILMADLHRKDIYHHDAKATNFVYNDACTDIPYSVCIVDCDDVTFYTHMPQSKIIKNLAQFLAGTGQCPQERWHDVIRAFLNGYQERLGLSRQTTRELYLAASALEQQKKVETFLTSFGKTHLPDPQILFNEQ